MMMKLCIDCRWHKYEDRKCHVESMCERDIISPVDGKVDKNSLSCIEQRAYDKVPETFAIIPCGKIGTYWEAK
jgi:hypothetical protein